MSEDVTSQQQVTALQRQVTGLSRLHQLQRQLRDADSEAQIGFMMVNETRQLVNYRQAVWWLPGKGVQHASGLTDIERNSPYVRWCNALCSQLKISEPQILTATDVSEEQASQWQEFLPSNVLAIPVSIHPHQPSGILLLARDEVWQNHELGLLGELADIYGFGLRAQRSNSGQKLHWLKQKRLLPIAAVILIGLSLLPVRLTVLSPAEVVARDAQPVRAPYEGVIDQLHVRPNQAVKAGDLLLSLDASDLRNRLQIAQQALQIARTEYRQVAQQAVFDERGKLELAIRRGMEEKSIAEVRYLQSLLQRTEVRASTNGIVVFTDASDWIGRPVALGERIMTLADPAKAELRVELPVRDAIPLQPGGDVSFFMNIAPDAPKSATLEWLAFRAAENDEQQLSYTGRATFPNGEALPRIGLRGTAKLYGERAPVIYYLLRRPLAALRQWVGF